MSRLATSQLALDLRSYPHEVRAHDHPHHQVILALEGALDMEIGRQAGRVDRAGGALVPAGTMHAFAGIGRNKFVTLDIAAASAMAPRTLLARGASFFAVPRAVEHLLAYVDARPHSLRAEMDHVAPLLAAALTAPETDGAMPEPLQRAIAFLRRAHRRPVACDDAARAAGLSTARLHALFAQWIGMGPGRYLSEIRLGHARDRLAGGGDPIAAIALDAGFSEQSAFSRAFRRRYGESPAAYRRRENRHRIQ
ncbi:MAG TPA: AraC family transcriptional regulator [Dongiaceae bacterium]|jgi:AraC-like DNA-binding protein|nr:AraC family transcriptional regulator [Dongiaceae bacterium]